MHLTITKMKWTNKDKSKFNHRGHGEHREIYFKSRSPCVAQASLSIFDFTFFPVVFYFINIAFRYNPARHFKFKTI